MAFHIHGHPTSWTAPIGSEHLETDPLNNRPEFFGILSPDTPACIHGDNWNKHSV